MIRKHNVVSEFINGTKKPAQQKLTVERPKRILSKSITAFN